MERAKILLPLLLLLAVSASRVQGATTADDSEEPAAEELSRPRSAEQFEAEMKALLRQYGNDYAGFAIAEAAAEAAWREEIRQWNELHPDDPVSTDDDADDGDQDTDEDDERDFRDLGDAIDTTLLNEWRGNDESPDAVENRTPADSRSAWQSEQDSAVEADGAGTSYSASLEGAVEGVFKTYTYDLLCGGINPASHSLAGLFPDAINNLPLVDETDEAWKKLVGYTETVTNSVTIEHSKAIGYFASNHPDWEIVDGDNSGSTNWAKFERRREVEHEGTLDDFDETNEGFDWEGLPEVPDYYLDEAPYASFDWSYGGFNADKAGWGGIEAIGPVIGDLSFSKDGLRFHWENGLSAWNLDYDDASAIACLFVQDNDGNWIGGKFDWISTSRSTRDFKNVYGGYNGWDLSNVPKTTTAAFVVVSRDGKWRSNVITATWER